MDDVTKQRVKIGVSIACLATALVIAGVTMFGGGGGSSSGSRSVVLLCANPDCGEVTEMSPEEFQEMLRNSDTNPMMMMGMGTTAYECPVCGKKSAYIAEKCEKCGAVFVPDYQNPDGYPDRCPDCGYSKYEERQNKKK